MSEMGYSHFGINAEEEDTDEPLDEEMVRQAIGGLLPDGDDLLQSMHAMSLYINHLDEDVDIFSSGGGLEMDGDIQGESRRSANHYTNHVNDDMLGGTRWATGGFSSALNEHMLFVEHPSRTLFVRSISNGVDDSELRALFEPFGDIRNLYSACKHRGFVMVSYFDIRAARTAMRVLQNKQLRNKKLDIHFSFPKDNPSDKDMNQGTLVIFNVDASISSDYLLELFGRYGEVREIRETPHKSHHRFIEFYDIRDAESALKGLNRAVIGGRCIKLEPSRPGGTSLRISPEHYVDQLEQGIYGSYDTQPTSPSLGFSPGPWEKLGNSLESGSHRYSARTWSGVGTNSPMVVKSQPPFNNTENITDSPTFRSFLHTMEHASEPQGFGYGNRSMNTNLHFLHQHYLSPLNGNPSSFEKQFGFNSQQNSPDTPLYGLGSLGSRSSFSVSKNVTSPVYSQHGGMKENFGKLDHESSGLLSSLHFKSGGSFVTNMANCDVLQRGRFLQRTESNVTPQPAATNVYQLNLKRILLGEDTRTTLMIKNIPNKYTVEMLLEMIDKTHRGMYDFVYLPIDFKNNCNVGYAFINMISPSHIISIYELLDGKKWERFNSEKVASLAYARIQGTPALVSHFQSSSLMNEDKRCQPIVFDREGRRKIP